MRYRSVAIVAGLGGMLALLAVLQYRWSDEISRAERQRMQASLRAAVAQFRQDFYRDLIRITSTFSIPPGALAEGDWSRYAQRIEDFQRTANRPDLVAIAYFWDREKDRLQRFDPAAREFLAAEWPERLRLLRQRFESDLGAGPPEARMFGWTLEESIPALFRPVLEFSGPPPPLRPPHAARLAGFTIVDLNAEVLEKELLPDLAHRYFGGGDRAYRVAVLAGNRSIYQSDSAPPGFFRSPDLTIPLLPSRPDELGRMFGGGGGMAGQRRPNGGGPFRGGPGGPGMGARGSPIILAGSADQQWTLAVRHRAGSLETVISTQRMRNLAISFGILLLLAVTLGMIMISTQRARRLAQMQIEFVAGVSHELRTPLAVICSASDNLAEGVVGQRSQVQEYGALIREEGRRLTTMVEQILRFAAGQAGRASYEIKPLGVEAAIDEAVAAVANGKHVEIERQIDRDLPPVLADAAGLRQILQNLVGNAMKYGGDWAGIRARCAGGRIEISVEDHGMGIDPEDLPHIFEPFYRGKAATAAQIHGTGLGLSLAHEIAVAMGGTLSVKSQAGTGTTFTLRLPAAATTADLAPVAG